MSIVKNTIQPVIRPVISILPIFQEATLTYQINITYPGTVDGTFVIGEWSRRVNGGAPIGSVAGGKSGSVVSPIWSATWLGGDDLLISYTPDGLNIGGVPLAGFTDLVVKNSI